ncbi:MAG TPA: hypothetical protein DCG51_04425 [Erysipelotrichaceae bacterium]|nr:hypothetical protein [Erysipelotrichaceae bacterium]
MACSCISVTRSLPSQQLFYTSILGLACVPSLSMNTILKASFGNNTFAFLLFSFVVAGALTKTTIIKRIAVGFVTNKLAQKGPWQLTFLFFTAIIAIGCFISPSVLFIVMLPIMEEMCELLHIKKGDGFGTMLIIGLVCCCGIASGMTPIGHAYGPLAIGAYQTATGTTISYGDYMAFAVPVGILTYIGMFFAFRFVMRPDTSSIRDIDLSSLKNGRLCVTQRKTDPGSICHGRIPLDRTQLHPEIASCSLSVHQQQDHCIPTAGWHYPHVHPDR